MKEGHDGGASSCGSAEKHLWSLTQSQEAKPSMHPYPRVVIRARDRPPQFTALSLDRCCRNRSIHK